MPHNASAAKRLRQNEKRRVANKARTTEIKSLRKQLDRAIHDGLADQVQSLSRQLTKRVDQAASVGTVHKNTASRLKSRVALAIARPPAAKAEAKAPKAPKA